MKPREADPRHEGERNGGEAMRTRSARACRGQTGCVGDGARAAGSGGEDDGTDGEMHAGGPAWEAGGARPAERTVGVGVDCSAMAPPLTR